MVSLKTTRMSSKGQVVIPESIRDALRLRAGTQFIVVGNRDGVILKPISPPSLDQFEELITAARKQAKQAGLKKSDIAQAVRRVRDRR
jgi:AbrB family looped-hinge helix DNA binding protein